MKNGQKRENMIFKIILEKSPDGGYAVHCPTLKGCWSQGDTQKEALENIKDAIKVYLKTLEEITVGKKLVDLEIPLTEWLKSPRYPIGVR